MDVGFSVENGNFFSLFASWETLLHFFSFFFHLLQYWKQFARDWFWCYAALWIQRCLIDIWDWDEVAMQECAKLPLPTLNSTTPLLLHENAILLMAVTAQMSPWWDSFYLWKAGWPRRPCESQVATAWTTAGLDSINLPWQMTVCMCFCCETTVLIELGTHQEINFYPEYAFWHSYGGVQMFRTSNETKFTQTHFWGARGVNNEGHCPLWACSISCHSSYLVLDIYD